ncbi:MAG: M20/M25/M40 family metallo-hydrolase, partial [Chloroflexales bacterium]
MTTLARALVNWLEPRLDTYLEELRQLCAIECPSSHKPGVDAAGAWVRAWATARGWAISDYPDDLAGAGLVATLRGGGKLRAMLVAHLDTVYPVGVAAERPLRREGNTLLGPGSADNKSGLLSGLYAAAALAELAPDSFGTLSVVCGGDEETDTRASEAMLKALAPGYDIALVLEAGRESGDIVSARKGGGMFTLEVAGRAAHAGVEPEKGASAVLALAHQIVERADARGGRYDQHVGHTGNVRDGREIAPCVERQFGIERGIDAVGGGSAGDQRIAVGCALGDDVRAYVAARARTVVDQHLLPEFLRQLLRAGAHDDVDGAAGRERHHDAHR